MNNSTNKCHRCNYPISAEDPICAYCGSQFLDLQEVIPINDYNSYHSRKNLLIFRSSKRKNLYFELEVKEELFWKFNEIHLIYRKFDRQSDLYAEISHTLQYELRHIRVVPLSQKNKRLDMQNLSQIGDWKFSCQSSIDPQQIDYLCTQFSNESRCNCYDTIEKLVLEKYGAIYLSRFAISSKVS